MPVTPFSKMTSKRLVQRVTSVHVNFGTKGWTISVHDDFGTYEINFGTRDFCSTVSVHRYVNFGT